MKHRVLKIIRNLSNDEFKGPTIFKYHQINKFFYDLLINNELWFSDPLSFNDPFDCNLNIDANNNTKDIEKYYKAAFWNKQENSDIDTKALKDSNFSNKKAFQRKLNSMSKEIFKKLGISCFAQTKNNLLMWAHYADEHKGAVLEFNYEKDHTLFNSLKKVSYIPAYPAYNYTTNRNSIVSVLILNKSKHWEYEEEIRLIKSNSGLYIFNPNSLAAIYFGARTPTKQISTIKNLIISLGKYDHVKLYKAELNKTSYDLKYKEINKK